MRGLAKEAQGESHEAVQDLRVSLPRAPVGRSQATTLRNDATRGTANEPNGCCRSTGLSQPGSSSGHDSDRPPDLPCRRSGFRRERMGSSRSRRLNDSVESTVRNLRGPGPLAKASSPLIADQGVGAAIVVGGRESRPQGEGRQSVGSTKAEVAECQRGGSVAMNVGEMQRLLGTKLSWTDRGKAGCGESRTSGLGRGVGKRTDDGRSCCETEAARGNAPCPYSTRAASRAPRPARS
jgi:hypothetical protein